MQDALPDNFGSRKSSVHYQWSIANLVTSATRPEPSPAPDRTDTGGCSEPPATAMKVFPSGSTGVCQWSAAASMTVIGAVGCIWPNF